ncbi:MAG: TolB family protein, partial [Acidobacteriota bacterium]
WYDSEVAPAGLYAMQLAGGDVISLTRNECRCYGEPHLWGRQVVYETWREGPRDIHIVDVDTLEDRAITHSLVQQFDPAFDGQWVVWTDSRNDPSEGDPYNHLVNPDIFGLELPDGTEQAICDHPAVQLGPRVHDGLVSWTDYRNSEHPNDGTVAGNTDIFLLDLRTGIDYQVTSSPAAEYASRLSGRKLYYLADDATGAVAVFEVDLVERLGIEP